MTKSQGSSNDQVQNPAMDRVLGNVSLEFDWCLGIGHWEFETGISLKLGVWPGYKRRTPDPGSFHFQTQVAPIESGALREGESGQIIIVVSEGADFLGASIGEVALNDQDLEAGALA